MSSDSSRKARRKLSKLLRKGRLSRFRELIFNSPRYRRGTTGR